MNLDKVREHYSAYFEGTLDRGLKQSFERMLQEDEQIAQDYRTFEIGMESLSQLSAPVEAPEDLFERISARVDRHVYDQRQTVKGGSFWSTWLKPVSFGAVGIAIAGLAFLQISGRWNAGASQASVLVSTASDSSRLEVKAVESGVAISYPSGYRHTVSIIDSAGTLLEKIQVSGQSGIRGKELTNPGTSPRLIEIVVDKSPHYVALPGSEKSDAAPGEGTLKDMALAFAGTYQVPVWIQVNRADEKVTWTVDGSDMLGSAVKALQPLGLKAEVLSDEKPVLKLGQD